MAKRKPGRPRKVAESSEFPVPEAVKRKPGRPRKIAFAPLAERVKSISTAELFGYHVHVSNGYGTDIKTVYAHAADIYEGRLFLRRDGRIVAAFNTWDDFIEMMKPIEPPKVEPPEVTLSPAAPPENIPDSPGYQFQGTGNEWPSNGALNAAREFPEATRQREEAEAALARTGA